MNYKLAEKNNMPENKPKTPITHDPAALRRDRIEMSPTERIVNEEIRKLTENSAQLLKLKKQLESRRSSK